MSAVSHIDASEYARIAIFVIFGSVGLPALYNVWQEHGWGAAVLLFGIYLAVLFIAVRS